MSSCETFRLFSFLYGNIFDCLKQQTLEGGAFRDDPYRAIPFFRVNCNIVIIVVVNCDSKDFHGRLRVHDLFSFPEVMTKKENRYRVQIFQCLSFNKKKLRLQNAAGHF